MARSSASVTCSRETAACFTLAALLARKPRAVEVGRSPAINIQAIAQRTGVAAATLRKWEERYGVLKPARTAGAHRRYSDRDVARVEWLKARLAEGYRIGEAARLLGNGADAVPGDPAAIAEELVEAAVSGDAEHLVRALDRAFVLFPAWRAISSIVEPALAEVGRRWATGDARVVHEHVLTELTRGKVHGLLDGGLAGTRGRAVLCCVPGERHDLGVLALAVLLHADGWSVVYLGADTPLAEAAELAARRGSVLCVSATMPELARGAEEDLARIREAFPGLPVVTGGPAFGGDPAASAVRRLSGLAQPATAR
jgi:DNA-binding transcriptional MerR regulator